MPPSILPDSGSIPGLSLMLVAMFSASVCTLTPNMHSLVPEVRARPPLQMSMSNDIYTYQFVGFAVSWFLYGVYTLQLCEIFYHLY